MSVSLPSHEIYAVDVPEVNNLTVKFQYNFFTPDESVSDDGSIPSRFLERSADKIDSSFLQQALTRVPRLMTLTFSFPKMIVASQISRDLSARDRVFGSGAQNGSLIADHIDKVVSEDNFSSGRFASVGFHDSEIDDKIYCLVSSSFSQYVPNADVNKHKIAQQFNSLSPNSVKPHFLSHAMSSPARDHGTRHFRDNGTRITNEYYDGLKGVAINVQINGKLLQDMTNRSMRDPGSPFSADLHSLQKFAKNTKQASSQISESDFKTFAPYIDIKVRKTAHQYDNLRGPEIVGYLIDKVEILPGGNIKQHQTIIIDNPRVNFTADFKIKYGTTYVYSARSVALFTVPAIDDDSGDVAMIKVLVSSKPSNKVYVTTTEMVSPPPPTDLNFTWDYERPNMLTAKHDFETGLPIRGTGQPGSLLVHWTFPPNSQRDIKKFQVFRRTTIDQPFELIKMYDFDDSILRFPNLEDPDQHLIEYVKSPATFFFDDDFDRDKNSDEGSAIIYTIASLDAHGLTSNYSAQFAVWFDRFKNRLCKKLISHSGAPKPYPNLYLEADTFVDTIRISNLKKMKVYFNPEFYYIGDNRMNIQPVVATRQVGGKYVLQFINLDNQKSDSLEIFVDDQTHNVTSVASPSVKFGPKQSSVSKVVIGF